jgi:hypothetical protein
VDQMFRLSKRMTNVSEGARLRGSPKLACQLIQISPTASPPAMGGGWLGASSRWNGRSILSVISFVLAGYAASGGAL